MKIVRTQWPVGQGCFATGLIDVGASEPLHYVYDCGARSLAHLEPLVAAYARKVPEIDALFVSHLDGDHVDGLDTLLARLDATSVYLPYLSAAERLLNLAEAEYEDRRLTSSFVQAQFDPAGWFGRRGVERVVFVRNGGDGRSPETPPVAPREGGGEGRPRLVETATVTSITAKAAGTAALLEMQIDGFIAVMQGSQARDWILQPYVPRVDDARIRQFESRIRQVLALKDIESIDNAAVERLLKTPTGRTSLRKCYDEILRDGSGSRHNAVSMSLYSGPRSDTSRWNFEARHDHGWWIEGSTNASGWIGTGDAKLKSSSKRKAWKAYYRRALHSTGTLLLPHHGSRVNFHADLVSAPNLYAYIAAADERDEGYRHPSAEVVEAIDAAGKTLIHVTKRLPTRFIEKIEQQ